MLAHTVAAPTAASAQMPSRPPICAQSPVTTSASAAVSASASSFCLPCHASHVISRSFGPCTHKLGGLGLPAAQAACARRRDPYGRGRLDGRLDVGRPIAARWAALWAARGRLVGGWMGRPDGGPLRPVLTVPTHTARPTGAVLADPASVTPASNHPWWQNCCVLLLTERTAFASKSCAVLTAMPNQQPNQKPNQNPYPEPNPEPYQNPYPEPNPKALPIVQPHVQPNALPRA